MSASCCFVFRSYEVGLCWKEFELRTLLFSFCRCCIEGLMARLLTGPCCFTSMCSYHYSTLAFPGVKLYCQPTLCMFFFFFFCRASCCEAMSEKTMAWRFYRTNLSLLYVYCCRRKWTVRFLFREGGGWKRGVGGIFMLCVCFLLRSRRLIGM